MLHDPDKQRMYEELFDLFTQPGWATFMEATEERKASLQEVRNVNSIEELHKRQGQLHILDWVSQLKEITEATYNVEVANEADDGL